MPLEASSFQSPTPHSYSQHSAHSSQLINLANPQHYGHLPQQAAGPSLCPSSTPHIPVVRPLYDFPIDSGIDFPIGSEVAALLFSSPNDFLFSPQLDELSSYNPTPQQLPHQPTTPASPHDAMLSGAAVSTGNRFSCLWPHCTSTRSFSRFEDLDRHYRTLHTHQTRFTCPVSGCRQRGYKNSRPTFRRGDKLREHLRKKHAVLFF
jgi:hypothetical protein